MRIAAISVRKLFGIFDHSICLNIDERITLIHGPNGFGKTTLLKMLNGFFSGRFSDVHQVPFELFEIHFEDGSELNIRHSERNERSSVRRDLVINFVHSGHSEEARIHMVDGREADFPLAIIEDTIPNLTRIGETTWRNLETGEELSFSDVLSRYEHYLPVRLHRPQLPEWLRELSQKINIRFIESQRLLRQSSRSRRANARASGVEPAVAFYAEQIAKEMGRRLAEYAELSQSLDQTFPMRLVEYLEEARFPSTPPSEIQSRIAELESNRKRLRDAGLLEKEEEAFRMPINLQNLAQQVLPFYLHDVEQKLAVFGNLVKKLELFKRIVSERFQYKFIQMDREQGMTFVSFTGEQLSPTVLSSGEQNMLVLWSELLFLVDSNALVLIDEPEISLHVAWQLDFLEELGAMTELNSFDTLIATHSPQIVNNRWDLTVDLEGPEWRR